ncbi:hypothetical protein MKEN_01033500 [Mycena kentingensis (nom. inval.)]|nr:hypothetical protein MKEN_01033500 [Mycena kentingensis (nom. inval.)]
MEGEVFGDLRCNDHLVPLAVLDPAVSFVLTESVKTKANVTFFNHNHVTTYFLSSIYATFRTQDEIDGSTTDVASRIRWLVDFWRFMQQWLVRLPNQRKWLLLQKIERYHLLVTRRGTLRRLEQRAFHPIEETNADAIMDAWGLLSVPFLHPELAPHASAIRGMRDDLVLSPYHIHSLIEYIPPPAISKLDTMSAGYIRDHLVAAIQRSPPAKALETRAKEVYAKLPIFPLRVPDTTSSTNNSERVVGPVEGNVVFLRVDDTCPVPVLSNLTTFFDVTAPSGDLAKLLDSEAKDAALDERGVLELSIGQLTTQPTPIQNALLRRIVARLADLSAPSIKTLAATPFVPVVGSSEKLPPSKVIDPRSKLAPLYEGEKGKLPSGQWATERQLALLTPHIPFLQHLTPALVEERVAFLNKRKDKDEYKKAQLFLRLLIKSWGDIGAKLPAGCLDRAWMPINADTSLALPSECRDMGESPYLFDLVLYPVADRIRDAGLRRALGWGELSLDTLRQQLNLALNKREDQADRLLELITELARRQISEGDLTVLRDIVSHSLWIPTDDDNGNLAGTDLALLRSAEKMPGGRFKPVHHTLVKGVTRKFLVKMGCKADPSLTTLLNELELLVAPAASAGTNRIDQALRLLAEIATNDCTPEESARILVPGRDKLLHPLSETYYKDTHDDEFLLDAGHAAHSKISEDLARELGMQFASSLELGDDEEEDDMQMGEDFTKRVEGVLKEHDIQYALNEFLANAVDAHANTFSIIVDERVFDSEKVLAPKLAELQRRPSLFFHNDSTFSAEDLAGLRSVGQGGKRLNPDSIGRYGLGALGLFHFTDVVFLVTATYFLVLDPSGTYLPPRRGGKPRTSLLWTIERVARRYPDQLAAFEGVCDFSAGSISYPGTLFRLPLREASGPLSSNILRVSGCVNLLKEQYYGLAKDAMFFTRLQRVSASYRSPSSVLSSLWTVTAQRPPTEIFDEREILVLSTTLEGQVAVSNQRWLVARSILPIGQVPIEHHALISDLGLTQSRVGLVTRVALRLDSAAVTDLDNPHFLFSSLRLPVRTSLPVHVSAQFAISSDRRHVRFDPADQTGQRLPEVAFNIWILEKLVPPLLIFGLCLAAEAQVQARHPRDSFVSWPTKRDKGDEISTLVIRAFYALAVKSPEKLCLSVSGGLVAPAAALMANYKTPPDVLGLLTGLVKPTDFIDPPFAVRTMLADAMDSEAEHDQIRFVNSEYLREVLCPWTAQLVAHFNAARDETNVRIISAALCFLLEGKVSIADLPLLVLADGTLAAAGAITRYLHRGPIPPIFDKARFLDERIDVVTEELLLASPDANVKRFDADAVLSLLKEKVSVAPRVQHPPDVANWIVQFWACFGQLPGPPEAEKLKTLPLILTTDGQHISLQQSTRIDVLRRPVNHNELHDLILALGNIGFTFCTVPASAPDSLGGQPIARGFTPNAVLEAVRDLASPFADLSQDEVGHIANWVQLHLGTIVDSDLRSVVRSLPIWQARHNGEDVRRSMNDLKCLPHGVVASAFDEFVPRNSRFALAPASYALSTAMFWYPVVSALDSETMARLIVLPESLTQVYGPSSSVASYKTMLAEFLKMPGMGMISVPDGQMRLRDVGQLFDPSVDLFREALFSVRSQRFPHDGLIEQFSEQLRARGLRYQRSWPAFLLCATTVHEDLTQRHQDEAAVLSRARVVFEFYNNLLPGLAMADEHKWNALDALRFVPRLARRSNSSTYESDAYCGEMPLIVAPSQIIRPEFEQISWSQRALFAHPASADLLSLNSTLGVPKVAEVVNHLAVLALQVAPDHPRNSSLLSQLRATYKWLNDKKADAQPFLVARSAEPLFLNVDDADAENWDGQWKSAEQLQFDIPYDYPTLFQVRRFLQDYRQLVLAAGAGQHYTVAFTAAAPAQSDDHIRSKFNEMRLAGRRTDIKLLPENAEGAYDENTLRAHWSFLIATLPHLEMAESGWSEGAAGKDTYTFPGTYFGARAVLDFLYTGKIVATPEADGHMDFLRDLLELLQGADQWGMSELKDEIGSVIAKFGLLSSATYWNVFDEATKYNAASLLQYCNDFRLKNPRSVESRESEQMDIAEL